MYVHQLSAYVQLRIRLAEPFDWLYTRQCNVDHVGSPPRRNRGVFRSGSSNGIGIARTGSPARRRFRAPFELTATLVFGRSALGEFPELGRFVGRRAVGCNRGAFWKEGVGVALALDRVTVQI